MVASDGHLIIRYVPASCLGTVWGDVAPLLEEALKRSSGESTLPDIRNRLLKQTAWLLVAFSQNDLGEFSVEAAFYIIPVSYDSGRALRVVLAAGTRIDGWLEPLIETLEEGCESLGATRIEVFGRPGWTRKLREYADHTYTVMVRKVKLDERRQPDYPDHRADSRAVGAGS